MKNEITILSIDDDKSICFGISAIIKSQGWKSIVAYNVDDGIKSLIKYKPTLILLDYRMPFKSGIVGIEEIRKIDKDVPIIMLTVDDNQNVANKCLSIGANDFAIKPIKAPDLISRINVHLKLLEINKLNYNNSKSKVRNLYPLDKGISESTLKKVLTILYQNKKFITVDYLSNESGLSLQSTYRYLQFLTDNDIVIVKNVFGKIGRPKKFYILKEYKKVDF
ncbi:response regulator [Peptoniphilus porci]|uniref:Response regulatory domain-containing protein n=1 Tax=Peptoniphilus porci TaxID=2652280 RepID=A0A1U7M0X5_9FIRM|nr:response regulator [Peptoniphilus porci]OLR65206.1 hypothetical protein BIV18_06605 [Peptoniphilus porci]